MKYTILIIALFISAALFSQNSFYALFPDSNATWNFHFTAWCGGPNYADVFYSIVVSGDTVINNQEYDKFAIPSVLVNSVGNCGSVNAGYIGALRQDTILRRVYIVPPDSLQEELLYDFTLQVGDTVTGYLHQDYNDPNVVLAIDSILVGSGYRKRWLIHPGYNVYFIEGIGSTYGLKKPIPDPNVVDLPDIAFLCFSQNGQTLYPDTLENCDVISSVRSVDTDEGLLKIYPNPSSGSFTVRFPKVKFDQLILFDLSGRILYQSDVKNKTSKIIRDVPSGNYILEAVDEMGRKARRKVMIYSGR